VGLVLLMAGCAGQADTPDTAAATSTSTTIDLIEQHRQEDLRKAREADRARERRCDDLGRKASAAWGRWAKLKAAGQSTSAIDREIERYTDASVKIHCPTGFEGEYDDYPEPPPGFDPDGDSGEPYGDYEPEPPEEPEQDIGP
jgi:hypothetical protein